MNNRLMQLQQFMFYQGDDGLIKFYVAVQDETIWMMQKSMAEVFDVGVPTINEHLGNIFNSMELLRNATIRKFRIVQEEGARSIEREIDHYNLDAIISVGYCINSYKATKFRQWHTQILQEHLIKGFVMDDEHLKQGGQIFGKDYFDQLLEHICKIRASARRLYQKITDIYQQCSYDYDKDSPIKEFLF